MREVSALGKTMAEKLSPVEEKVQSSTPVMRAPKDMGKVDLTWLTFMSCRTTDCERGDSVRVCESRVELCAVGQNRV